MEQNGYSDGSPAGDEPLLLVDVVGGAAASRVPLEISLAALAEEGGDPRLAAEAERLAERLRQAVSGSSA